MKVQFHTNGEARNVRLCTEFGKAVVFPLNGIIQYESSTGFVFYGLFQNNRVKHGTLKFPGSEIYTKLGCAWKIVNIEYDRSMTVQEVIKTEILKQVQAKEAKETSFRKYISPVEQEKFRQELKVIRRNLFIDRRKNQINIKLGRKKASNVI